MAFECGKIITFEETVNLKLCDLYPCTCQYIYTVFIKLIPARLSMSELEYKLY